MPFEREFLFLDQFIVLNESFALEFKLVIAKQAAIIVIPLLAFTLLLFALFKYLPILFLSQLPILPKLFSLIIKLQDALLLASLQAAISALFLSLIATIITILTAITIATALTFPTTIGTDRALLFRRIRQLFKFKAVNFFCRTIKLSTASIRASGLRNTSTTSNRRINKSILIT